MTRDDEYRIDFEELDSFIKKLAAFRTLTEERMTYLDDVVEALAEKWRDDIAMDAYRAAHGEWKQGAQSIQESLEDFRSAAKNARTVFSDLQTHQQKMWPS
ncbi:hypothetical protein AXK57_21440 [Tsukamurella pulmonis]|uniref:WXG100 family type VII secretion target n=1 Tax=Tsukamurella pulmonis TaxID=47312 RepID=UPI00079A84ED|nr:WXG100 family type VII secretion target [Tsukamurella pulmonis]KXP11813.1 hypothetical protein AXK57_21440 [Tsukamurella pulmonis]